MLKSGDAAYQKKDYKTAVQEYSQAFELLPTGAMSHQLRQAAAERYATAATEHCRSLAKNGRYDDARALLDTVLAPEIAPGHLGALKLKGQIDDPIRYNHALTPEHVGDIVKVSRNLRIAEGHYNLGQYNKALQAYQAALRIDPFNKAARRGMERVNVIQSDYYRAARDHTRASMLAEVDKNWELYVPAAEGAMPAAPLAEPALLAPDIRDKLAGITVDTIDLEDVSLEEALDFVRLQSRLGDAPDAAGEQAGVNIILNVGDPASAPAKAVSATRVNLKARGLPLSKVLDYITDQTRTQWRTDGVGVLVTPVGTTTGELMSRSFRVPPNFLQAATISKKDNNDNPFGEDDNDDGKLPTQMSITDFLKQSGVSFPDGASATYSPANNTLIVRNTPGNIDLVDQLVRLVTDEEPVLVVVKTCIIRVSEEKLKELGFDWAITPLALGGSGAFLGGGTTGNGTPLGAAFGSFTGSRPVTSGNRSGNLALPSGGIDTFLNSSQTGIASSSTPRAPGILKLTAITNGIAIEMMMRGLNQNTGADIMVKPSTISRSGERSKIEVIREFIYPTEYEPPELPNNIGGGTLFDPITGEQGGASAPTAVTPAHPTAFETRNVGVTLEVEPTVGADRNYIELSLRPELVQFEGFVNYGSPINGVSGGSLDINLDNLGNGNVFTSTGGTFGRVTDNRILMPVFKTVRLQNSTLTIQDGATVVLGGVMTSRKTKTEDKTPLLGDIPYVGRLFRSEAERTFREAVIVTVNAELVDPTGTPWRNR
ncbi:MAG: tetratricopeptide repeat protein [Akkermansiaceae bacterium]|nr:tetratricopeptide repeat protein [Akkermansiaceae bacterium]